MSFVQSFTKSITSLTWLRENKNNTKHALLYFSLFVFIVSVITMLPATWQLPKFVKEFKSAYAEYVSDFEAEFKDGELIVSGLDQPHTIQPDEDNFLVVVDTVSELAPSLDDYKDTEVDVVVLVTKNKASFYDAKAGKIEAQEFRDIPDGEFSKSQIDGWLDKVTAPLIALAIVVLILFVAIFMWIGKIFYVAIISLLLLITVGIAKKGWSYGQIFTVGLFSVTAPTLAVELLRVLGLQIPIVYTGILLAYLIAAIFYISKSNVHEGKIVEQDDPATSPGKK